MAESPYIVEVTAANFEEVILHGSMQQPVLVDFWASWCQPCQMLMPLLAKLADEYQGRFILAKINTEEQQEIAAQFGIRSIPTVKLIFQGRPLDEFTGALPEAEIRAFLDKHIPRESDNLLAQAEQLMLQGDTDGALALIKTANQSDPQNSRALIAYARIQAVMGNMDEARSVLDALPADAQDDPEVSALRAQMEFDGLVADAPEATELEAALAADDDNSEARYQLAAHRMMENRPEEALELLLTLVKKDRQYGDDAARKLMLKIFESLGNHPLVGTYRSRLMSLIY